MTRPARSYLYRCRKCSSLAFSRVKLATIATHHRCGGTLAYEGSTTERIPAKVKLKRPPRRVYAAFDVQSGFVRQWYDTKWLAKACLGPGEAVIGPYALTPQRSKGDP